MIVRRIPNNLPINYDMLRRILFKTEFIILKASNIENKIRMIELYIRSIFYFWFIHFNCIEARSKIVFLSWLKLGRFYLNICFVGGLVPVDRTISEIRAAGSATQSSLAIVCLSIVYHCMFHYVNL